jgi:HEAT repeat protein
MGYPGVESIRPYLRASNVQLRRLAVQAVKQAGIAGETAIPDLKNRLGDPDLRVRMEVAQVLRELGAGGKALPRP